jgi:hypothetical protein
MNRRRTDNSMAKNKKNKRTNSDLQNTTHKTKDRAQLKTGDQLICSGMVDSSCSNSGTHRVTVATNLELYVVMSIYEFRLLLSDLKTFLLCLYLCPFSFGHCVVCPSLIYGFRLLHWYLQILLIVEEKSSKNRKFNGSEYLTATFGLI